MFPSMDPSLKLLIHLATNQREGAFFPPPSSFPDPSPAVPSMRIEPTTAPLLFIPRFGTLLTFLSR